MHQAQSCNSSHCTKGRLEIICGSMFSGKSQELLRRLNLADYAKKQVITFSPTKDTRDAQQQRLVSHDGRKRTAYKIEKIAQVHDLVDASTNIVAFDEVQFFPHQIIQTIMTLLEQGKQVIASGLDLDFRGMPFPITANLMALSDTVTKLKAICIICSHDAHFSQRLVNGQPAHYDDPTVLIGTSEHYQPRCRNCFFIKKGPRSKSVSITKRQQAL